ncbi:hypothetical protein TYRP_005846 [Tyrophagus putrescentiae]|nr:hypothetical protein TYRP_005846 [Tyrophagus putrescentiae]
MSASCCPGGRRIQLRQLSCRCIEEVDFLGEAVAFAALNGSIYKKYQTQRLKDRVYTGRTGINSSFLEDNDEDDESISIAKIKNQYKSGGGGQSQSAVYSSSDSDSNDDDFKGKRRH